MSKSQGFFLFTKEGDDPTTVGDLIFDVEAREMVESWDEEIVRSERVDTGAVAMMYLHLSVETSTRVVFSMSGEVNLSNIVRKAGGNVKLETDGFINPSLDLKLVKGLCFPSWANRLCHVEAKYNLERKT